MVIMAKHRWIMPMDKSSAHGRTQPTFQSQNWRFCLFWAYRLGYTIFSTLWLALAIHT